MREQDAELLIRKCHDAAVEACLHGKYKANRFPPSAALYDQNALVRGGAALIFANAYRENLPLPPFAVKLLEGRLKTETDKTARFFIEYAIDVLTGKAQPGGEG
jgi:hypothetical protein